MARLSQAMAEDAERFRQSEIDKHKRWVNEFNQDRQDIIEGAAEQIVTICSNPETPIDEAFGQRVQALMPVLLELAEFSNMQPPKEPRFDANGNRIFR